MFIYLTMWIAQQLLYQTVIDILVDDAGPQTRSGADFATKGAKTLSTGRIENIQVGGQEVGSFHLSYDSLRKTGVGQKERSLDQETSWAM